MNTLQLELTKLIGSKELSFGCIVINKRIARVITKDYPQWDMPEPWNLRYVCIDDGENIFTSTLTEHEIIWHPATLSDFHKWMNENVFHWSQWYESITYDIDWRSYASILYDSSKELLEQSTETLQQIINLIISNS